jgi:hypothetical protein
MEVNVAKEQRPSREGKGFPTRFENLRNSPLSPPILV